MEELVRNMIFNGGVNYYPRSQSASQKQPYSVNLQNRVMSDLVIEINKLGETIYREYLNKTRAELLEEEYNTTLLKELSEKYFILVNKFERAKTKLTSSESQRS